MFQIPQTDLPVDAGLLQRAIQAGARIASTRPLTVFKFSSAWRRDSSYRHRDTSGQQAHLARLQADPAATTEIERTSLIRAHRELRLHYAPKPSTEPRNFQTFPGFADVPPEPHAGLEWHVLEHHPVLGLIRWSGPAPVASLVLPVSSVGPSSSASNSSTSSPPTSPPP